MAAVAVVVWNSLIAQSGRWECYDDNPRESQQSTGQRSGLKGGIWLGDVDQLGKFVGMVSPIRWTMEKSWTHIVAKWCRQPSGDVGGTVVCRSSLLDNGGGEVCIALYGQKGSPI